MEPQSTIGRSLAWLTTKLLAVGCKRAAFSLSKWLYDSVSLSEIFNDVATQAARQLYHGDESLMADYQDRLLAEYGGYLFSDRGNHEDLSGDAVALENVFNELLPKKYPAAMITIEALKNSRREANTQRTLQEIKDLLARMQENSSASAVSMTMRHDIQLFQTFDKKFSEERLKYSLEGLATRGAFNDYELQIWLNIIYWLEQSSNSFADAEIQQKAQQLRQAFVELQQFTGQYYSTDHQNWLFEDDTNVSPDRWRQIHEAQCYTWKPDVRDPAFYSKRERIVLQGLQRYVPAVLSTYHAFRIAVTQKLGV